VLLPGLAGLDDTWTRINQGDPTWLGLAVVLELASFAGYLILFRTVFARATPRLDLRVSYQITMAGVGATRLFATAGVGGILLTAWALTRAGMSPATITRRMTAFLVLLYGVFMIALVVGGLGLWFGLFEGPAPFALTVVPALFGAGVIASALALASLPSAARRRPSDAPPRSGTARHLVIRARRAAIAVAGGVRAAMELLAERRSGLAGAPAWWAFDIAVLWACFHAFGEPPPPAVVIVAYFVGMLANTLPAPGGIGAVDGGMVGALAGFGVPAGLALVAVLSYRAFAFWVPTIPGIAAYLQLIRTVHGWDDGSGQAG
jgi:uncharacterized membrane protein YbhN (UPF0104 family)